jgi:glycosyltransferase involved in cell wall biosynthesis
MNLPPANKRSRLAYVSSVIPKLSATFIYREILEMDRRGYELVLYSLRHPEDGVLSAESLHLRDRTFYLLPVPVTRLLEAHIYYLCVAPVRYFRSLFKMILPRHHTSKHRYRSLLHFVEGVVLARRVEADHVTHLHAHYASQPASVARVVSLLTGIPYSFSAHAHDIWSDRILLPQKLAETRFVACCSALASRELVKQGAPCHAEKVHIVYHGIDVRRFQPPPAGRREACRLLAVGRLDEMKGFHYLLEACHLLQQAGLAFRCTVVGEGDQRGRLEALVRQCGLEQRVALVGAVPQERLLDYYHEASLFVLPSLATDDGRYDGIPNVIVEAMATGLPVIGTTAGAIPEAVMDGVTGFIVPQRNAALVADRTRCLMENADLRDTMGRAARHRVEHYFDSQQTIAPLLALFDRACGVKPSGSRRQFGRTGE